MRLSLPLVALVLLCALAGMAPGPIAPAPAPAPTPIAAPSAPPSALGPRIDALVAPYVAPGGPGLAVAVVRDGVVQYQAGYGMADVASAVAITPETRFDLASVSKQFTAMAILVLVSRGAMTLDDDVRTYLPELTTAAPTRPIRIRDLLSMRSGLTDYIDTVDTWDVLSGWTNDNVLQIASRWPLEFATGTMYAYSNTNYALLALIVQRVSGQRFGEFLRTAIFEPAGMHQSVLLEAPGQAVPNRARGYAGGPGGATPSECDTSVVGDGQVFTSVTDLALWDDALRRSTLVAPKLTALMFTRATLDSGIPYEYAMGYFLSEPAGHVLAEHDGSWMGTATWIGRFLTDGVTVIVLSNNENLEVGAIGRQLSATVLGVPAIAWE